MKAMKGKVKPPDAVEKADGLFRLKAGNRADDDQALLSKGGLKVDELAGVVSRLTERVRVLEEKL
jgi:hypothetical protein